MDGHGSVDAGDQRTTELSLGFYWFWLGGVGQNQLQDNVFPVY